MRTFRGPIEEYPTPHVAGAPVPIAGPDLLRSRLVAALRRVLSVGPLARSAVVVAGGTAIGQLLVVAASPLISRLYGPSDVGILAVYSSLVAVSLPVALLRYDLAIQLPRTSKEAARLLVAAISVAFLTSTILGICFWLGRETLTTYLRIPQLARYVFLLPVGILGASLYMALSAWTIRTRRFADVAKTRVTQQIGLCVTQLGLGLARFGPVGLLLGDVVGRAGGITTLCRAIVAHEGGNFQRLSPRRVILTARRHAKFAVISSAAGLLNTLGLFGPPLLFASLFGPVTAGEIALGQRVIALPLTLAGQAVAQVYLAEVARLGREMPRAVPALLRSTVRRLVLVAVLPSVLLIAGGPDLFALAFGERWRMAGSFARVLAFAFAAQMIAAPVSQTLNVLGRSRQQLAWDFGRTTLVLGGIWTAWRLGSSPFHAVIVYSTSVLIAYAVLLGMATAAAGSCAAADSPMRRS